MDMHQSFLHSPAWESFQQKQGWQTFRYDQQLFMRRPIPGAGNWHYWLSSRCHIPADFQIPEHLRSACFLRFEPLDATSLQNLQILAKQTGFQLVSTLAVQPRQTIILDLKKSYLELLNEMKQKHRYNIKLAQKHGVEVGVISNNLTEHFERFWALHAGTAERQVFNTHPRSYYENLINSLEPAGEVHFLFAEKDGQDLATMLLITHAGTATYLHGGSNSQQRELMAPYLLHAEAIQLAQKLGCTEYDLWGTDLEKNAEGNWQAKEGSASAGTSRFKLGFGGTIVEYPGTFDLILQPFCYTLYKTVRHLRGGKRAFV